VQACLAVNNWIYRINEGKQMNGIGMMFPGQGAQFLGMGKDIYEAYPEAREVFDRADQALKGDLELSRTCFEGPADRVNATDVCQPGILVTSLAFLGILEKRKGLDRTQVRVTAGLSLGEYTAHVFAGSLRFEDAVRLVRKRGQYMLEASKSQPSGMLSLMGSDLEKAQAIADRAASKGIIAVANLNAPGQVVLSGAVEALDEAEAIAPEFGVRRCRRLVVSGAFHSPIMNPAADKLGKDLELVEIQRPEIPVIANVTAEPVEDPEDIRSLLARQVIRPVRWEDSVRTMKSMGISTFFEPGPNRVLGGLLKKIDRDLKSISVSTPEEVESFVPASQ